MKVAFQGERGAYSEEATRLGFADAEVLPYPRFSLAFEALVAGDADRAVIPIENSQAGTITETYDLLLARPVHIVGEIDLRVRHCLLAIPGQALADIRTAHSHPQALAQTEEFLQRHRIAPMVAFDTAGSARQLAETRQLGVAAVASRVAAGLYALEILAEGIETNPDNRTRFVVLAREPAPRPGSIADSKTSLAFALRGEPGALYHSLGEFAQRGINITKLESRPSRRAAWEYFFYLDLDGHREEPRVVEALAALNQRSELLRVFGSYRRAVR